jgi:hypothetical protein
MLRVSVVARSIAKAPASVRVVSCDALRRYIPAWEELARCALEPNVFYEPWMLLPAIEHIRDREQIELLLVFGPAGPNGVEPLWGLFPLELQPTCLHLPMRTLALWQHRYCYLTVPLVHKDHSEQTIEAFWRWFENNSLGCRVLDTNYLLGEGPFHAEWADAVIGRYRLVLNEHPRGLQMRAPSFDLYISNQLSKKRYHAIRRGRRHLEELGLVGYSEVESIVHVEGWIEQFLHLESSGWKGREGGAMAIRPQDAEFFRDITYSGFAHDRARLLSLELNGNPIAMKLVLTSEDGGHIFKIAYDERYSKYSPGGILELEDLERWHSESKINWIDTCASARHPLYDLISNERRVIRRTLISDGSWRGDLFVSALPFLRYVRRRFRKGGSQ